jgi:hypothetical protein
MNNTRHNSKQCSIFYEFNSIADIPGTLTISLLQDCRGGDGCSFSTDRDVIHNVLSDFSGDPSVKMELSEDHTHEGLVLTLSDNSTEHPVSTSRIHSNRIGMQERDEEGWVWYSRGEFAFNKNGGRGYYENTI